MDTKGSSNSDKITNTSNIEENGAKSPNDQDDTITLPKEIPAPELFVSCVDEEEENTKLTLAYGKLYEIPRSLVETYADNVKYLDISHNMITNLDALVFFNNLTSLIADNNPITENCILPPLPKLQLLWMNHCKITSLYPWVGKLRESCSDLKYLCLMGNPAAPSLLNGGTFYEYLQYRLFVISQFPSLNHLDDRKVTEDQRIEAQRLYKRPFFERFLKPGLSSLVNKSVTWNTITTFGGLLKGKEEPENIDRVRSERNLLI